MASTYTISDAFAVLGPTIIRAREEDHAAYLANMALNEIWMAYDWRESLASLPPFYIIPQEQEYNTPSYTLPDNFHGLRQAYLVQTSASPVVRTELKMVRDVRPTHIEGIPSVIGYNAATSTIRLFPRPPASMAAPEWMIDGEYKKRPTKITPATIGTTLIPWDDLYFGVFVSALRWASLEAGGDPRAGSATVQNGVTVYTGALGTLHAAINRMASDEGLNLGDPSIAPSEPLVNDYFR